MAPYMMAIDEYAGQYPLACALKLAPMLFVQPTELRCATWQEFDLEAAEWRIPSHMTMRRTHIVPLFRQALTILKELKEFLGDGQYLFPSTRTETRPISDATMLNALRRKGYQKHEMSVYGFHSIPSTIRSELGYNRDWIERRLAHGEGNGSRPGYVYAEYRQEINWMMQQLSNVS